MRIVYLSLFRVNKILQDDWSRWREDFLFETSELIEPNVRGITTLEVSSMKIVQDSIVSQLKDISVKEFKYLLRDITPRK